MVHLDQTKDSVRTYGLKNQFHVSPWVRQTRTWQWRLWALACLAFTDHGCSWVKMLEDFPLALPDGDECVATGRPQVVLILLSGLLSLLDSSVEPCIRKLVTIVPVIQTAMELEHGGGVLVIAIHGQVSQPQSHLRSIASMQQTCQPTNLHHVGQPLEGVPTVTRSIAVHQGTIVHREVRPTPGVTCANGHVRGHAPGVKAVGIKANQGKAGEGLGSIVRLSDGGVSNFHVSLEHDGRPSYDGHVHQLHEVSLIRAYI